jgi:Zn-dependent protease
MSSQNSLLRKSLTILMPAVNNTLRQEITELALSTVIISISFGIAIGGGYKTFGDPSTLVKYSLLSLLSISLGFVLHELGHRIVARGYGYVASYSMWIPGLILALITSFGGWIFAAPGAVLIRKKNGIMEGNWININHFGKIALAGPFVNIVLSYLYFLLMYLYSITDGFGIDSRLLLAILFIGAQINITLALFNLIPFGPFDGSKIFKWNKLVWLITAVVAIGLFFYLKSPEYSLEKINAPKPSSVYKVETSTDGNYTFEYPSNWYKVENNGDYAYRNLRTVSITVFSEKRNYAEFGLIEYKKLDFFTKYHITDSNFAGFITYNQKIEDWEITERTTTTIRSIMGDDYLSAYELRYLNTPERDSYYIETITHTDDFVYVLFFSCGTKYYPELKVAYTHFLESCRIK